jgi:hypothetical protein
MVLAETFWQVIWTMFIFFLWVIWLWLLFTVFIDIFRNRQSSGFAKAGWSVFVILLPFLGVFVYFLAEGKGMAERNVQHAQAQQAQMDTYVRSVAGPGSADEIAKAKDLLDSGAISQAEFDQLKAKALTD